MSVRIIAELGINHNGDFALAEQMVVAAKECGCDGVKIQAYRCSDFLAPDHPDWEMFKRCELSWAAIFELKALAHKLNLEFGATPTSTLGILQLSTCLPHVDFLKNGSDFLLRSDLIEAMVATGIETWVSMGMATDDEYFASPHGCKKMHCTSVYPCPDEEVNLDRLSGAYPLLIGFSDHTQGISAAIGAVAAAGGDLQMIEKHFTLDKTLDGPDHWWSADPAEMRALVREVRRVEKMLGSATIEPTPSELVNREKWRVREGTVRTG